VAARPAASISVDRAPRFARASWSKLRA
jgi:hypothetical protein